mgnify:CR=1 FL=1
MTAPGHAFVLRFFPGERISLHGVVAMVPFGGAFTVRLRVDHGEIFWVKIGGRPMEALHAVSGGLERVGGGQLYDISTHDRYEGRGKSAFFPDLHAFAVEGQFGDGACPAHHGARNLNVWNREVRPLNAGAAWRKVHVDIGATLVGHDECIFAAGLGNTGVRGAIIVVVAVQGVGARAFSLRADVALGADVIVVAGRRIGFESGSTNGNASLLVCRTTSQTST